jgi:Flp pilus assembly protein TadG
MSDHMTRRAAPSPVRSFIDKSRSATRVLVADFWRERRGVAMIEFAVTMPLMVALLLPLVDLGMGFYRKTQLMTAAEAGAQYAWLQGFNSATIKTAVQNATGLGSTAVPLTDITVTLSCKCVDKTTSLFTATSPVMTPTSATDCTSTTNCSYSANNYSTSPGAYVTVTITPATACSTSSTDAVCYKPLFTYGIFGGPVDLTVTSTVRVS